VDDRRVISGIVHMLRAVAGLPAGVRSLYDHLQSLRPLEPAGHRV
jgi:hypothetical protein